MYELWWYFVSITVFFFMKLVNKRFGRLGGKQQFITCLSYISCVNYDHSFSCIPFLIATLATLTCGASSQDESNAFGKKRFPRRMRHRV